MTRFIHMRGPGTAKVLGPSHRVSKPVANDPRLTLQAVESVEVVDPLVHFRDDHVPHVHRTEPINSAGA